MKKKAEKSDLPEVVTPVQHEPWPSYTMVEGRMKKIYFDFYQETYKKTLIDRKTKELIAIAASLGFKCQGCLEGHIKKAKKFGATPEEISEAISIAMGPAPKMIMDFGRRSKEKISLLVM